MKKNLSKAMAAAMAVAAVAPVAAQPIVADAAARTSSLVTIGKDDGVRQIYTVDLRAASGYGLVKRTDVTSVLDSKNDTVLGDTVFSRQEAFDGNLTPEIADDTLKAVFGSDAIIVATKAATNVNLTGHKYVIGKKLTEGQIASAKLRETLAKESIENLRTAGYTITEEITKEEGFVKTGTVTDFVEGEKTITARNSAGDVHKFIFTGVTDAKKPVDVASLIGLFTDLISDFKPGYTTSGTTLTLNVSGDADKFSSAVIKDRYYNLNSLIMFLNTNADKFEIVKYESADRNKITLEVYKKGLKNKTQGLVQTVVLNNVDEIDTDLIVGVLGKTDFDGHWAQVEIETAMANGWVDSSNTFRPNDSVTRAEFAKMVCTIFDIDTDENTIKKLSEPFNDVKSGDWYYKYIVALYNYKSNERALTTNGTAVGTTSATIGNGVVINGYEDETFKPNAKITREEAAKIMAAAYELSQITADLKAGRTTATSLYVDYKYSTDKGTSFNAGNINTYLDGVVDNVLKGKDGTKIHRDVKTVFTDDKDIAVWADESVAALNKKGILGGNPDGTFKPKSQITRAESLAMIMRSAGEYK